MLKEPLKILISDDRKEICDSLEDNILVELEKFGLSHHYVEIKKTFTEHAYEHGCKCIDEGFKPDICIFDLIFNGYTGIDLYKYIANSLHGKKIFFCIYKGIEKKLDKNKEAEILSSETQGTITIISKPHIDQVLSWFGNILQEEYHLDKIVEEKDPFDVL